jgi:putative peptide zinc metalloprotease protein
MNGQDGDVASSLDLWSEEEKPIPLLAAGARTGTLPEPARDGDHAASAASVRTAGPANVDRSSAADFAAERMLRGPAERPMSGWQLALFRLSAGLIHVGPSTAELHQRELVARVKTPIRGCRKIAFISRKGGVGKTTTCLLAGHTFAGYRGDRVVALDGNPDAGTLGHRIRRETAATVTSLLDDADVIERYADIRAYTSQSPTRLETIAGDDDPRITEALGEEDFRRAIGVLECHYNLVCLDTGPGVLESATQGILHAADQIVVVIPPSLDGARAASSTLDWLEENGHRQLVDGAVAVVNGLRGDNGAVDLDRIEEHFAGRCQAAVRVPWDPHLETGAEAVVEELRPETRQAYLELAAAIAAGFDDSYGRRS